MRIKARIVGMLILGGATLAHGRSAKELARLMPIEELAIGPTINATTAPTLHAENTFTPSGGHSVTLTCNPPTTGGKFTGFQFSRGTVTGGPYTAIGSVQSTCGYVDTDTTLQEGTTYFYVAQSVGPGGKSPNSNEASALIPFLPPDPPTGLQAAPK